jgi:class 3 adenylate cyclase
VRIERGSYGLPPPVFPEVVTLGSIGAPPNVRLACQIRPEHYLIVTRLLKSETTGPEDIAIEEADSAGVEKTLAVMFVDLRDFTRLAEKRLPFDVVYVLNEFFGVVGAAITEHGGWIDKFLGDGLLAVFGQRDGVEAGCRQAGHVAHLATPLRGRLRPPAPDALELARLLHPTPAVGGTPSRASLELIRSLEGFDRGRYAGPVGWVDARGDGEWAIALRGAELDGRRGRLVAGAGIVAGSDPEAEWAETQAKLEPMLRALVRP